MLHNGANRFVMVFETFSYLNCITNDVLLINHKSKINEITFVCNFFVETPRFVHLEIYKFVIDFPFL